jgi:phosphatidylglycerol:prolipoprotein diacylglycerol transferase
VIPYFEQPHFGPVHLFGILVLTAILVGSKVLNHRAELYGMSVDTSSSFITWILLGGFVFAHLTDRFVYFPEETMQNPWTIVYFWQGISSFGGFLGGTLAGLLFFRLHVKKGDGWKLADAFCFGFPFGWIFGRLGCFSAFDHPGKPTSFFLGQMDYKGIVRHNLGLEEALYSILIAATFYLLGRKPRPYGFYVGLFLILYSPFRFCLDFLRIVDVRYFHFTPGQYGSVILFFAGIAILLVRSKTPAVPFVQPKDE